MDWPRTVTCRNINGGETAKTGAFPVRWSMALSGSGRFEFEFERTSRAFPIRTVCGRSFWDVFMLGFLSDC